MRLKRRDVPDWSWFSIVVVLIFHVSFWPFTLGSKSVWNLDQEETTDFHSKPNTEHPIRSRRKWSKFLKSINRISLTIWPNKPIPFSLHNLSFNFLFLFLFPSFSVKKEEEKWHHWAAHTSHGWRSSGFYSPWYPTQTGRFYLWPDSWITRFRGSPLLSS